MNLPKMAGVEGVEPSHTAPETAVLPLDDTPVATTRLLQKPELQARVSILVMTPIEVKP